MRLHLLQEKLLHLEKHTKTPLKQRHYVLIGVVVGGVILMVMFAMGVVAYCYLQGTFPDRQATKPDQGMAEEDDYYWDDQDLEPQPEEEEGNIYEKMYVNTSQVSAATKRTYPGVWTDGQDGPAEKRRRANASVIYECETPKGDAVTKTYRWSVGPDTTREIQGTTRNQLGFPAAANLTGAAGGMKTMRCEPPELTPLKK